MAEKFRFFGKPVMLSVAKILGVAATALAMLCATPSAAALVSVTFAGTLDGYVNDGNNLFGWTGPASLDQNAPFRATFTIDTSVEPTYDYSGGTLLTSAAITGTLDIAGTQMSFTPGRFYLFEYAGDYSIGGSAGFSSLPQSYGSFFLNYRFDDPIPIALDASATVTSFDILSQQSGFSFSNSLTPGACGSATVNPCATFSGSFNLASITFNSGAPVPQVPEPASWMLLLAGFGLLGAVMRRARDGTPMGYAGAKRPLCSSRTCKMPVATAK